MAEGTDPTLVVAGSHGQLSIASVERDTGIPKETLRVWERRYGFPAPVRDAQDDRVYSAEDLEKLRLIRRLIAVGHRPGKILNLDLQELVVLSTDSAGTESEEVQHALGLLVDNDVDRFEAWLATALARDGLKSFVLTTAPGLTVAVGEAWARGKLQIHHEHVFSEIMTRLLRTAIAATPRKARAPRVLMTTFPLEPHTIGLLMAEAMFAISGCACISLGPQTPVPDIALAAGGPPGRHSCALVLKDPCRQSGDTGTDRTSGHAAADRCDLGGRRLRKSWPGEVRRHPDPERPGKNP